MLKLFLKKKGHKFLSSDLWKDFKHLKAHSKICCKQAIIDLLASVSSSEKNKHDKSTDLK